MIRTESGQAPDVIYRALRTAIIGGQFQPGQPLRQEDLAQRYGTSRIPVREALRQLEMEGFVTYHPRAGAVVADISLEDALEVMEIRIALECRALRLAIPNMTDTDLSLAREIHEAADQSDDMRDWDRSNRTFHLTLYAPAEKPRLLALITSNLDKLEQFAHFHVARATGKERPISEHLQLLEACERGDVEGGVALLEAHIAYSQKDLAASERHRRYANAVKQQSAAPVRTRPDLRAARGASKPSRARARKAAK